MQFPFCSRSLFFSISVQMILLIFFSASSFFFLYMIFEMTVTTGTIRLAIKLLRIFWVFDVISSLKCNILPTFNIMNNSFFQTLIAKKKTITKLLNDEFSIQFCFQFFPLSHWILSSSLLSLFLQLFELKYRSFWKSINYWVHYKSYHAKSFQ